MIRAAALALLAAMPAGADAAEVALRAARPATSPLQLHVEARDGSWHVRVLDPGGVERQRFAVATEAPGMPPRLLDADGDGAADLWLPVTAGTANATFALWRMQPARAQFVPSGEILGSIFTLHPAGYLVATARSGCCTTEHIFHRFAPDGVLARAFTLTRRRGPALPAAQACAAQAGTLVPPADLVQRLCAPGADRPLPGKRLPVH
ncbi:hypothetical protein [Falsiroseomonas sp.]|uniref:hypothetical protein n=1 Tax=Falsiroseomonas sp. TaxID=2870721 RepID=UPI003564A869